MGAGASRPVTRQSASDLLDEARRRCGAAPPLGDLADAPFAAPRCRCSTSSVLGGARGARGGRAGAGPHEERDRRAEGASSQSSRCASGRAPADARALSRRPRRRGARDLRPGAAHARPRSSASSRASRCGGLHEAILREDPELGRAAQTHGAAAGRRRSRTVAARRHRRRARRRRGGASWCWPAATMTRRSRPRRCTGRASS